jgi:OFA family oxalate/formate antiporter-like MFS transporter
MPEKVTNRWLIAAAGVVMQLALGAVYAWSVFRKPLSEEFDTSVSSVNLAFTLTIVFLGLSAYFGGLWMAKVGPRKVAITAGLLYGAGVILTSLSSSGIALLYLAYGVLAGIGLGLGYIVPIATLIKWFPDKRGVITGIAVAGFGGGAVVTAPVAKSLISSAGVFETFAILGVVYAVLVIGAAMFIKNPPEGYKPEGWEPDTTERSDRSGRDFEFGQAVRTWQWFALWSLLFLNVTAGIAVISEASPMAEEIAGASATAAAGLVALIAIFNGFGRFAWAAASDVIGRRWVFLTMFVIQIGLFVLLPNASSYVFFAVLACAILLCYGGGFGTMPAFAADYFGSKNVGRIYGLMLTAWSAGGVAGPLLISKIRDSTGNYDTALYIIAGMLAAACIIPLIVRPPGPDRAEGEAAEGAGRFTRKDEAVSGDRETARSGA